MSGKMSVAKNIRALVLAAIIMLILAINPAFGDDPPSTPTAITCIVFPASVTLGGNLTVSGSISPGVQNVTVNLIYTRPNGTALTRTVTSDNDGAFRDTNSPDSIGSWSVKSSWLGNAQYLGSTSFGATFEVRDSTTVIPVELLIGAVVMIIIVILVGYWYAKKKRIRAKEV